ncbi:MAG: hypothetical protein HKN17_11370 [Rhodothermales bacterium]|nr:hypothetical protein [Rhodothermales bacterium]
MRHFLLTRFWIPVVFVGLSGCLPSSCNRTESRALLPADSLSRSIAADLPVDTLRTIAAFVDVEALSYPRTLGYAPDGRLWVADSEREVLLREWMPGSGAPSADSIGLRQVAELPGAVPWLAGFRGDTVVVYSPAGHEMLLHSDEGELLERIPLAGDRPERGALTWAAADSTGFAVKVLAEDFEGYIGRLDRSGAVAEAHPLAGEPWLHAGMVRTWNGRVVSLRGYFPAVDIWTGGQVDSVALVGFDSPMLSRTRGFLIGDVNQPPLLTASAAPLGDLLFVLNMRPGWLRVDVFDENGRLRHILTQSDPEFRQEYFPTDLAVRRLASGAYELSVSVLKPEARIDRYRWQPDP